ncbi:MAG: radical SAM protein [Elusimicrobia bacterium]|nr:radical SAM protein [Elusimicrobiota bacterium]
MAKSINHLVIYLSSICNMKCAYCYVSAGKEIIKEKSLLAGIDFFCGLKSSGKKITFLGGEPLLHFRLLENAVRHIRKKHGDFPVQVFTNGTVLNKETARFLQEEAVRIIVSIDGPKEHNDVYRKFSDSRSQSSRHRLRTMPPCSGRSQSSRHRLRTMPPCSGRSQSSRHRLRTMPPCSGRSTFDALAGKLKFLDMGKIVASLVVTPSSALSLYESVLFLYGMGFAGIAWSPDITAVWTQDKIADIGVSILKIRKHYLGLIRQERRLYEIANSYEIIGKITGHVASLSGCNSVLLAPDGRFYPCDKLTALKAGAMRRFALKISGKNFDAGSRKKFFEKAAFYSAKPSCAMCPVGVFAYHAYSAESPLKEIKAVLESHRKLSRAVEEGMTAFIKDALKFENFRKLHNICNLTTKTATR